MKKYAWLTDIHLEFLDKNESSTFISNLPHHDISGVFITGDISDSYNLIHHLRMFAEAADIPVYFVLGNHDYYGSSFNIVQNEVKGLTAQFPNLNWLLSLGVVKLSNSTCLIGHDGWADGRFGDYTLSSVVLNDYLKIDNFSNLGKDSRLKLLHELAGNAANYIKENLHQALNLCSNVILLTHPPPYKEACWYQGRESTDEYLPHFASKVMGEAIQEVLKQHKDKNVTVYCGHTHTKRSVKIHSNLVVNTGTATYGKPELQGLI